MGVPRIVVCGCNFLRAVKRELFLMAGAVELILDFGIRAPFLDDLAGNALHAKRG